ncbi:hypothetical protein D3H65_08995 [Paraflavitalea soli]|uniref:Lipocalin-like domain-containing protein n=1 Tax=Paraflavitalea soli TaxID=2315862 RepID=A0A3B7MLE2_9BACT|nr:hypothetical protein [Paraflavitalea soli]AXY74103.1 hypothetical protein D3H65_08995 [Paraflavitalea soli]
MKNLFRKTSYVLLIPVVFLLSFAKNAERTNFSGDWKLNESKSELGDFSGFVARSLKVEQKENAITITRTTPGFNGGDPVTSSVSLSYDGKITESEGFGGSKRKTTAKWSDDGLTLTVNNTITFERDGQTNEFKSTETWTLKDGLLSIVTYSNSPRGETTTKAIYTH